MAKTAGAALAGLRKAANAPGSPVPPPPAPEPQAETPPPPLGSQRVAAPGGGSARAKASPAPRPSRPVTTGETRYDLVVPLKWRARVKDSARRATAELMSPDSLAEVSMAAIVRKAVEVVLGDPELERQAWERIRSEMGQA